MKNLLNLLIWIVIVILLSLFFTNAKSMPINNRDMTGVRHSVPLPLQGNLHQFLIIGQSNAVGHAAVPAVWTRGRNLYTFQNSYRWAVTGPVVDNNGGQVDMVSFDKNPRYGFGLPFGVALEGHGYPWIGLIPAAKGSTSIFEWQRSLSDQTLYGSALKRVNAASTMGHLDAIIFFQGESEARSSQEDADQWAEMFMQMVNDFRTDLNDPTLPVIFAQISCTNVDLLLPYCETVAAEQASISDPYITMVVTSDLPHKANEPLHLNVAGYNAVGQRFADAVYNMIGVE